VQAYLVMGRLDLAAGRMEAANYDVMEALKIEPGNSAVEELGRQVAARKPQGKPRRASLDLELHCVHGGGLMQDLELS